MVTAALRAGCGGIFGFHTYQHSELCWGVPYARLWIWYNGLQTFLWR